MSKTIGEKNYEKFAERYAEYAEFKVDNAHYDRPNTIALLPDVKGLRVLDAGCGPGIYAEWLLNQGATVVAFDVTPAMVEITRKRVGDHAGLEDLRVADVMQPLDFAESESFDVVLCPLVLDYVEDWAPVFKEFARVLKQGGIFVFSCGHPVGDYAYMLRKGIQPNYRETHLFQMPWGGFGDPKPVITSYRRPISAMLNPIAQAGLMLEEFNEAPPTEEYKRLDPERYARYEAVPGFMFIRARKV